MALSNSQYDAIMREYGRQQIENHHKLEERRKEIYARLPVVRQLEAEIAERSVACAKKLLEGDKSVLDRLKEDLRDLREQKALIIRPPAILTIIWSFITAVRTAGIRD